MDTSLVTGRDVCVAVNVIIVDRMFLPYIYKNQNSHYTNTINQVFLLADIFPTVESVQSPSKIFISNRINLQSYVSFYNHIHQITLLMSIQFVVISSDKYENVYLFKT